MTRAGSINGVTRCLQVLADGLRSDNRYSVTWVRFIYGGSEVATRQQKNGYILMTVPLPKDMDVFLSDAQKRSIFWNDAYRMLYKEFKETEGRLILHLHTMNLAEFALLVRQQIDCKIVSHMHCIPWKGLLNTDISLFNQLYRQYYLEQNYDPCLYVRCRYEQQTYTESDAVICVTDCARDFITNLFPNSQSRIHVVPNGIDDTAQRSVPEYGKEQKRIKCLFVGNRHPSKGLYAVVDAIQSVQMRTAISLTIAGDHSKMDRDCLRQKYPFVDIMFTGVVSGMKLHRLYMESDIGIITSLQEQCSYVAIEMMMHGLPIIATQVDGLAEMFVNGSTAMTVPVLFNSRDGLYADPARLIDALETLATDSELRSVLGHNGRQYYETHYNVHDMIHRVTTIYQNVLPLNDD